jgi:hypothetical protein
MRDGTYSIVVPKFTTTGIDVYLPKGTTEIYLDIIENRRVANNDYQMYSFKASGIQIEDVTTMSKQLFAFQVSPRLDKQPDPLFDYNDES